MRFSNKPSTNILFGIMFIIFPIFIGVIFGSTFIPNMYVFGGSIIPFFAMFMFLLVLGSMLVFGILFLRKGLIAKKVIARGRKGTCVVERFETRYTRYGQRILMYVSFKGDDGKKHVQADPINPMLLANVKQGTALECKILGSNCYVDGDNPKIVDDAFMDEDYRKFEDKSLDNW